MTMLGVMSGTSLDGIDTVTARLERTGGRLRWDVLARAAHVYPDEIGARLRRALDPDTSDVVLLTELHQEVGQVYADVTAAAQREHHLDAVALSGQTVYHIPRPDAERGWRVKSTLQLGEASVVTERCGVVTVSDFRQSDLAAGGQGAPMVPFSDLLLYAEPGVARLVVNLGGIANVTYLPADGGAERVLAFDTGPANCLLDEAAERFAGAPRDEDGRMAAQGRADDAALGRLMDDPYLKLPPPKTTGREVYHLAAALQRGWPDVSHADLASNDVLATLTAFSAASVALAVREHVMPLGLDEVLVAGGGARNAELMRGLREALPVPVRTFAEIGFDDKDRETLAMAVMGYMALHGEPNVLPSATGAAHPVVAGKIARPYRPR
jgi:anhydro-N-acetylmuramic acid kinase